MSHSENEDDPEIYESSGEEWNSASGDTISRRSSRRLSKKPRISVADLESSSDESDAEPLTKRKSKNGMNKRQKVSKEKHSDSSSPPHSEEKSESNSGVRVLHRKFIPKTIFSDNYATGSFVILKKDAQSDPSKHPSIWRIDGKALLQKYEAFDAEDTVRHKNTSVYTGWSAMDRDLYAPVTVDVITHNNQNLTVQLHWDKLKDIQLVDSE